MKLYNVYWDGCPEVVWHKDLRKILKRYADVTYVTRKKKCKIKNLFKRKKLYDYNCVFDGSVYRDGSWDERGRCDIWYV